MSHQKESRVAFQGERGNLKARGWAELIRRVKAPTISLLLLTVAALLASACGDDDRSSLTVYSGRSESLVDPVIQRFTEETQIKV